MRHCTLLQLILGSILVNGCLAPSLDGGYLAGNDSHPRRRLLQSGNASLEALLEYDPAFDAAVELQALTALYEATGGSHWTYGSYFSELSSVATSGSSGNASATDFLAQRFQKRTWLDTSVSYCQW